MGKKEHIKKLDTDQVCENPYCNTLIKAGEPAVKITHWWNRKYPEWYHDMLCARKSPNITRRTL